MENFLLEIIRMFISLSPENALRYNLVHAGVLLFPLALFAGIVSIAALDDPALRARLQRIAGGMLLGLAAYRAYQVWWILNSGVESIQIMFLERTAPFIILGSFSGLIPAVQEKGKDSIFFAGLASFAIFAWLLMTRKLPIGLTAMESLTSLMVCTATGIAIGAFAKKARECSVTLKGGKGNRISGQP